MKVKDAVEIVKSSDDKNAKLSDLYYNECIARIELRLHGNKPTFSLIEGVIKEVTDWFKKLVDDCGVERVEAYHIPDYQTNAVYGHYKMLNPKATSELNKMRLAYQFGIHPLNVLTEDGLDAIGDAILGNIAADLRRYGELNDRRRDYAKSISRTYCPLNDMARDCENQETLVMDSKGKGIIEMLPTLSIEKLVFLCKLDKCVKGLKEE